MFEVKAGAKVLVIREGVEWYAHSRLQPEVSHVLLLLILSFVPCSASRLLV